MEKMCIKHSQAHKFTLLFRINLSMAKISRCPASEEAASFFALGGIIVLMFPANSGGHNINYTMAAGNVTFSPTVPFAGIATPSSYASGVDSNGLALGNSGRDSNWKMYDSTGSTLVGDAYVVFNPYWDSQTGIHFGWLGNQLTGSQQYRWIAGDPGGYNFVNIFKQTLDLIGYIGETAEYLITGGVDGGQSVGVNGLWTSKSLGSYNYTNTASLSGPFLGGKNTVDVYVAADGVIDGLRVHSLTPRILQPIGTYKGVPLASIIRSTAADRHWTMDNGTALSGNSYYDWAGERYNWLTTECTG
jgi:hypothetical protein